MFRGKGKNIFTIIIGSILILIGGAQLLFMMNYAPGIQLVMVLSYNLFGGGAMVYYAMSTLSFRKGREQQQNPDDYLIDLDYEEDSDESVTHLSPLNRVQIGAGIVTVLVSLYTMIRLILWLGELSDEFDSEFGWVIVLFMAIAIPIQLVPMFLLGHNSKLNKEVIQGLPN